MSISDLVIKPAVNAQTDREAERNSEDTVCTIHRTQFTAHSVLQAACTHSKSIKRGRFCVTCMRAFRSATDVLLCSRENHNIHRKLTTLSVTQSVSKWTAKVKCNRLPVVLVVYSCRIYIHFWSTAASIRKAHIFHAQCGSLLSLSSQQQQFRCGARGSAEMVRR